LEKLPVRIDTLAHPFLTPPCYFLPSKRKEKAMRNLRTAMSPRRFGRARRAVDMVRHGGASGAETLARARVRTLRGRFQMPAQRRWFFATI
jgi:hypothetical protein